MNKIVVLILSQRVFSLPGILGSTENGGSFVIKEKPNPTRDKYEGFVHKKTKGDWKLICRIPLTEKDTDNVRIILKEPLYENDKSISLRLGYLGKRFARMGTRSEKDRCLNLISSNAYTGTPAWFKLKRFGNVIYAYESPDGNNWFSIDSVITRLGKEYYIGMFASSENKTDQSEAKSNNYSVKLF